jgi:hypothetical protein
MALANATNPALSAFNNGNLGVSFGGAVRARRSLALGPPPRRACAAPPARSAAGSRRGTPRRHRCAWGPARGAQLEPGARL